MYYCNIFDNGNIHLKNAGAKGAIHTISKKALDKLLKKYAVVVWSREKDYTFCEVFKKLDS